jgi:hypothetical protein
MDLSDRFVPESLTELWRLGEIPPEHLPAVLRAIEPQLKKSDRRFYLHASGAAGNGVVLEILCMILL